jgi:hypothetical protein
MIRPADIRPLSPTIQSAAAVRAALGFDELAAAHARHELFVLWFRYPEPFAIVMRLAKDRIDKDGWPLIVDPETRVVAIEPAAAA